MSAILDVVSSAANGTSGSTLSWSHTLGSLGTTGLIIVVAEGETTTGGSTNQDITGITFNGVSMNLVTSDTRTDANSLSCSMYELHGASVPAAGTYTVSVTYRGSCSSRVGGSISFKNIKNQNVENVAHSNANGGGMSLSVTTLSKNALVVVGYANQNALGGLNFSTGETTGFDKTVGSPEDSECFGGYKTVSAIGSTTSTLTVTNPQSEVLLLASFASISGGGGFFTFF